MSDAEFHEFCWREREEQLEFRVDSIVLAARMLIPSKI